MKPRVQRYLFLGSLLTAAAFIVFQHLSHPDLSEEEAHLSRISLPLKRISGGMYFDGGSVYLEMIDKENVKHEFVAPISGGVGGTHPTIIAGTIDPKGSLGTPLKDPKRAKFVLLKLIAKYRDSRDIRILHPKYALSGTRPRRFDEIAARVANNWWN